MFLSEILFYLMYKKEKGNEKYKEYLKTYLKYVYFNSEFLFSGKTMNEIESDIRNRVRNHQIRKEWEDDKSILEGKVDEETY